MRILSCDLHNFGSYERLSFDFQNQGLALIQGPTGSGKSTLCDAIPWILFARTAKNGAVDEVLPWQSKATTIGTLVTDTITITRTRKPNDLYFTAKDQKHLTRGKDLNDTQRLINELLGLTYETYLSGAYYHEFSQTAGFFTATAKNRRAICEQLVDLSLATEVQTRVSEKKKLVKALNAEATGKAKVATSTVLILTDKEAMLKRHVAAWEYAKKEKLSHLKSKHASFETDKQDSAKKHQEVIGALKDKIQDFYVDDAEEDALKQALGAIAHDTCGECGQSVGAEVAASLTAELNAVKHKRQRGDDLAERIVNLSDQLRQIERSTNTYEKQIEDCLAETNPHAAISYAEDIKALQETVEINTKLMHKSESELLDLELLEDVVADYRSTTLKNTINQLQDKTNDLLTTYFDAEIKVQFDVTGADTLAVTIFKDANECTFTQLSKGQRQLLKLCFGISVMNIVANHKGVSFNTLWMDEAFDGLDETLKVKAFTMLTNVAVNHENVFVVEHSSEIKTRFIKKFSVELLNGKSIIHEEA